MEGHLDAYDIWEGREGQGRILVMVSRLIALR
jgi:hypothetical protein